MSRAMSGVAVVALIVGALLGFLGSLSWSSSRRAALDEARDKSTRLERQVVDLRTENDRLAAQLKDEHARVQTIAGDLRREKEMNVRLHSLVSDGRK